MTKQSQIWEEELKANGWKPSCAHCNSPTWFDPEGVSHPGPGYAWSVLQKRLKEQAATK